MLVPAIMYKDEIDKRFAEYNYSDDMFNYTGCLCNTCIDWKRDSDDGRVDYAIVDKDKHLLGFFSYHIDWYSSCAHWFGLFAFERGSSLIGLDVYKELEKLIHQYHLHRIEWRMIGGNPVERHYDKFCQKYNGKKFVLTDATKDRYGNYHDDVIYEIILPK